MEEWKKDRWKKDRWEKDRWKKDRWEKDRWEKDRWEVYDRNRINGRKKVERTEERWLKVWIYDEYRLVAKMVLFVSLLLRYLSFYSCCLVL